MRLHVVAICGIVLLGLSSGREAAAQDAESLIGSSGEMLGNERFLRDNRRPTDFVGRDFRDMVRFIGNLQSRLNAQVTPSTQGIRRRVDRSATINEPLTAAPPSRPYNPRLSIQLPLTSVNGKLLENNVLDLLANSDQMSGSSRIEVSVAGRTATLQGEVPVAKDRDLAQLLVSFEPGISAIRNELVENPQLRQTPDSLASRREKTTKQRVWVSLSHPGPQTPKKAATDPKPQ